MTEGELTEPVYLRNVAAGLDQLVKVRVISPNQSPMGLANEAIRAAKDAKRIGAAGPKDQFWCMFDVDDYGKEVKEAAATAAKLGIQATVSNPCFEVWLLCHFEFSSGAYSARDMVSRVGSHVAGYSHKNKVVAPGVLDGLYARAKANALALDKHHETAGNSPGSAPSSDVHRLVDAMVTASLS